MRGMTSDRLEELRRIAEAGPAGEWDMIELEHSTVLALLDEIERLRREREVLADAVRAMKYFFDSDYSDPEESATVNWSYAHQKWLEALALLDGEKGGGGE